MNGFFINLLSTVEHTINQYHMFTNNSVYVALSGGKDSLFLCLALKELGYKVTGVTVDIGYNVSWSILKQNAENLGIDLLILTADSISGCSSKYVTQSVLSCFEHVKSLVEHPVGVETICTPCYNAKIIILKQWAESNHINEIAFGHHATDSIASLLKSYFYYYDHICCGSLNFEYKRFEKLVLCKL